MEFDEYFSTDYITSIFKSKLKKSNVVGVDGTTARKFEKDFDNQVDIIVRKCREGEYKFTRFRERLIPKGAHSKPRQISIPVIRDALVLRILYDFLVKKFPKQQLEPVYTYIKDIRKILNESDTGDTFLRLDVKEFYPSINQEILKKNLKFGEVPNIAIDLINAAITNPTGDKNSPPMDCGIPQGLSISNILASIYFLKIDNHLKDTKNYFRYVDDILFICNATESETLFQETKKRLHSELKLSVHEPNTSGTGKSTIQPTHKGIDYIGFHITTQRLEVRERPCRKVCLKVREKSYRKVFDSIINLHTSYARKQNFEKYSIERFLWRLNLRITGCRFNGNSIGWMFFFRQTDNIKQIKRLDAFVEKTFRKRGLSRYYERVKKFTKTYYEIQHNYNQTKYIPDFDNLDMEDKVREIALLTGQHPSTFEHVKDDKIDEKFWYMVKREVRWMERETIDFADRYY